MSTYENEAVAPITPEEERAELLFNEDDILKALSAKDFHEEMTEVIEIKLGSTVFSFRIRPLSEKEWDRCREKNTKYQKNRKLGGMKLPESTNTPGYHSHLIYTATVDEDRAKLWDNKRFWAAASQPDKDGKRREILTGTDMIDVMIPFAGKKQEIIDRIERLSGFDDDSEDAYDETVKN